MTEPKHARDMSPQEYQAKLAELRRGQPPEPMPLPEKKANQMTEAEREIWWSEHRRKFQ
jgi:hypothetical protein